MTETSKPYKLVICKERVKHLKQELKNSQVKCEKLDKMKKSFKNANDEHTRLLVQVRIPRQRRPERIPTPRNRGRR